MQTEIEAKALNVDHDALRVKLRALGATLVQPTRLMRRYNLDFPDNRLGNGQRASGWARIRDEGNKITMSYKELSDRTLHGTKEVSVTVDNFYNALALLESLGLKSYSYQETKRESWQFGDAEIELDQWPWTKPYVEIECPNEATLKNIFAALELDWDKAVFGSVEVVYRAEYGITDDEFRTISDRMTFDLPVPPFLEERRGTLPA